LEELRLCVQSARTGRRQIGLVPTMGALHEGHLSLIRRARAEADFVVVSIFVNPLQFGPQEDLSRYPKPFDRDLALCEQSGADAVFAPERTTVYPDGFETSVVVERLGARLEGARRPGHFRGVATVVLKLFNMVQPDIAYFGQKDAQQAAIIHQMVRDLNVPVDIRICPTVREPDGLALSSRNGYLNAAERQQATALFRALHKAKQLIDAGERSRESIEEAMRSVLQSEPGIITDYAEIVDPITFEPATTVAGSILAVVAARVGPARLIDNLPIQVHASGTH
jgi:pantoate--beta-alanine ligase